MYIVSLSGLKPHYNNNFIVDVSPSVCMLIYIKSINYVTIIGLKLASLTIA